METTVERVEPVWSLDELEVPYQLWRVDGQGLRWYWDGARYYVSVTSLIKATTPTAPQLIEWIKRHGDRADEVRDERAEYGTFMHDQIGYLLQTGAYDLHFAPSYLEEYLNLHDEARRLAKPGEWAHDVRKDVLAFAQFAADVELEPIAIELMLAHPDGYAGAIDLVARMNHGKQRVLAMIDMKSGRKGFWEEHELQLQAYKQMWEHHFPDQPIERLFNWSPKDWRSSPTYNLKNQTKASKSQRKWPLLVELWQAEDRSGPSDVLQMDGTIRLGESLEESFSWHEASDLG